MSVYVYVISSASSSLLLFHTCTRTYTHTPYSFILVKKQVKNSNIAQNNFSQIYPLNTHTHTHAKGETTYG